MHIKANEQTLVEDILARHIPRIEVWAFGSRVHGHNLKPFSDLDLVIVAEKAIGIEKYAALKHAFSESDLPFMVDVVEWYGLDESFKALIKKNYEVVQKKV